MNIEDLKRWHWLLLGATLGLLLALASSFALPSPDPTLRPPISELDLASLLSDDSAGGEPVLRDLTLHPDDSGRTFVTGEFAVGNGSYRAFALYTGRPFPSNGDNPAPDLRAYIDRLRAAGHPVPLTDPWWEATWFRLAWPTATGALLVGGLWPILLNLLIGAGFGRHKPAEDTYDLNRFGQHPDPSSSTLPPPSPDDASVQAAADRLESALQSQSITSPSPAPPATPTSSTPITPLTAGPVESVPIPTDNTPKEYKGEFYPVAKPPSATQRHSPAEPPDPSSSLSPQSSSLSPSPSSPQRNPSGFSLVELLVVIAIIGILIGLLLPALSRARRSANVVACASNFRQISYALQAYVNDHHGVIFWRGDRLQGDGMDWYAYGGRETGNANHDTGNYFNQLLPRPLNPYVAKNTRLFHCPCDDVAPWTSDPSAYTGGGLYPADNQFEWVGNSYNFNANGYPLRPLPRHDGGLDAVKYSSIRDSSHMIVFYEACMYWGGDWHYAHKANIAYADAHVSFLPLPPATGEDHWDP